MLADPEGRGARRQLRRASGCSCATCERVSPTRWSSPTSTTTCGRRSGARPSCSSTSIVREDRSVLDLLTADYTFVNERLARHYGIPNVYGTHFRRVTRRPTTRAAGLLGQGSILTRHVVPEPHLAGDARQVGAREPARHRRRRRRRRTCRRSRKAPSSTKPRTMRERMEEHRANPTCANCHRLMDPIGLALENFDARRRVAHAAKRTRRSTRPGSSPTARRSTASSSCGRRCCAGPSSFVRHDHREAADLCARPRPDGRRHAGGPRDLRDAAQRATTGSVVDRAGHRQQRAVPDADEHATMRPGKAAARG